MRQPDDKGLLDWPRTSRDPFEGHWEVILSLVLAHPEWSGSELLQEMQHRFPERYRACHLSSLQERLRKIRARLLALMQDPWPRDVLCGPVSRTASETAAQEREPQGAVLASLLADLPGWWLKEQAQEGEPALGVAPTLEEENSRPPGNPPAPVLSDGELSTPEPMAPASAPLWPRVATRSMLCHLGQKR